MEKEKYIILGDREREKSNFYKALEYYEKARKLSNSQRVFFGIAHCQRLVGNYQRALKIYKKILA